MRVAASRAFRVDLGFGLWFLDGDHYLGRRRRRRSRRRGDGGSLGLDRALRHRRRNCLHRDDYRLGFCGSRFLNDLMNLLDIHTRLPQSKAAGTAVARLGRLGLLRRVRNGVGNNLNSGGLRCCVGFDFYRRGSLN